MTAGMREGEKNAGQDPVWEKVAPLPATASQTGHGSNQPTLWEGLTALTPLSLGNFHLSTFGAGARDENAAALSLEGWAVDAEKVGKAMAASASSNCFWAMAEHHQEPHEGDATAAPWFR